MDAWHAALANFQSYLPQPIERWVLGFEADCHARVVAELCRRLSIVEKFDIVWDSPTRIAAAAHAFAGDDGCGFLELAVTDASEMSAERVDSLMRFASWPEHRVRFCFDVADNNFLDLFTEPSDQLSGTASTVSNLLRRFTRLRLQSANEALAYFECLPSTWSRHCGDSDSDYILPTGEIECPPTAASGEIDVDGWVIGTLPFGPKFGRLRPGDLILSLRGGAITQVAGRNASLVSDLLLALGQIPGLSQVSELGFGLSRAIARFARHCDVGCIWHERHFGAHVGIGATLNPDGRATGHHLDFVLASGAIADPEGRAILAW